VSIDLIFALQIFPDFSWVQDVAIGLGIAFLGLLAFFFIPFRTLKILLGGGLLVVGILQMIGRIDIVELMTVGAMIIC
jgi:hypothetical protein